MDIVCPPSEKRIDTIYADKFMTSTHKANTYLLELDRDSLQLANLKKDDAILTLSQKIKSKNTKLLILASILGLLIVLGTVGYFWSQNILLNQKNTSLRSEIENLTKDLNDTTSRLLESTEALEASESINKDLAVSLDEEKQIKNYFKNTPKFTF